MSHAPTAAEVPTGPERWPRPNALHLDLTVSLGSGIESEAAEFGWEVWRGTITATWLLDDADGPLPPGAAGWGDKQPVLGEDEIHLQVGRLERWLLPLNDSDLDNPVGTHVGSPEMLFDAGDAMSADLSEVMSALIGDDNIFSDDCYRIAEGERFDHLLILREIETLPHVRGYGVGAWASARSIGILARDAGTFLATKAAPLRRSEFLTGPDADLDRELTAVESAAWRAAQVKIGKHWRRTLGLTPLPCHPDILVGTIETASEPLHESLDAWTDHG